LFGTAFKGYFSRPEATLKWK